MIGGLKKQAADMFKSFYFFLTLILISTPFSWAVDPAQNWTERYPEVLWLADVHVRKTEEGQAVKGSDSERLFGKKFIEFDRTIMTLRCLGWILDGSEAAYQAFTGAQPPKVRLTFESFQKLHEEGKGLIQSHFHGLSERDMIRAMEAALVLGDIGKSENARDFFRPYGASAPDHDDFHGEIMQILQKTPSLCPTFERLNPSAQTLLIESTNLAHYGHITHLEGGPGMFSKLKESGVAALSPEVLAFDLFIHACDVAGALGHVDPNSSLVYTEICHVARNAMVAACQVLADPEKTEKDAYNSYVAFRANWLGLDVQKRVDRLLARIGAMLRLSTPTEGLLLKQAIQNWNPEKLNSILSQWEQEEKFLRTPTYMPAVLVNLANQAQIGTTREERICQAVALGVPFLSKMLEKRQESLEKGEADPQVPLNFNQAAGAVKNDPNALDQDWEIDEEGNVRTGKPVLKN